jgi:Sulfatase
MLDGVQKWDELDDDRKRLFVRMAELYAGYMEHTDEQIGRLIDSLEANGQLDNTLIFVFVGDNGSSGEGGLEGLFNEQSVTIGGETVEQNLGRIDQFGQPGSYNHYPVGWAMAGNTPFQLCKQYTHFGGVRNPLVVHWPAGIKAKGELRHQFHHVTDIVPTILEAVGVEAPRYVNTVQQEPVEGYAMNYSFDDADAPTAHKTQYYEMMGNRALYHDGWKIATYHGRKPWENKAAWGFDADHWELYNLEDDPSESNDLMKDRDQANIDDPIVQKMLDMVQLWWAEAGRYQVLPLDDRFYSRALGREGLYPERELMTFYEGATRIQPFSAPETLNRSWAASAEIEVPEGGADGPIAVVGSDSSGWAIYLKNSVPTFVYCYPGPEYSYIRATEPLPAGRHLVRYEFEKTGPEPMGAGGTGRLYVGDDKVAEAEIPHTCTVGYSMDETFDIGWDKGSPVTDEYEPNARFTGTIIRVDFDLKPDFHPDLKQHEGHDEARFAHAMIRQ